MEWKEARIFISSTFNDMHAERDYLVTEVFPELSEWCEQRRIRLTDIDLRWGVTAEDAQSGNTVRACLNSIDECRPFFLCFLGQRRGWVPDLSKDVTEETLQQYQGLREKFGSYSVTEMEIEHATLAPMVRVLDGTLQQPEKSKALFFFRNDPFHPVREEPARGFARLFRRGKTTAGPADAPAESVLSEAQKRVYTNAAAADEAEEDRLLEACRERIRGEWTPYCYDCRWDPAEVTTELAPLGDVSKGKLVGFTVDGKPLKDRILEELQKMIAAEFPENVPVTLEDPYDGDALEQHLFAQSACYDFTGREEALSEISRYLSQGPLEWAPDEGHALFVTGPEGTGKTTLLTKVWQILRQNGIGALYRGIRATDRSYTVRDLYLSIGNEAGLFRASEEERGAFDQVIDETFLFHLQEKGFRLLILDGLDRLEDIRNLTDKLTRIPVGFYLIISSDNAGDWSEMEFHYRTMELPGIGSEEARSEYVDHCLLRTLKKLDREQKQTLISVPGAESPLFLQIVLNELKSFGSFAELSDKISRFGSTAETAFTEVLRTIELETMGSEFRPEGRGADIRVIRADGTKLLFPAITSMLVTAQGGLDEDEILRGLSAIGLNKNTAGKADSLTAQVRMILRRMRPYLLRANRRYNVQLTGLRDAAAARYAGLSRDCRKALAAVFEQNLRAFTVPEPGIWREANGAAELLYHLEALDDWDGIRRVIMDPEVYGKLSPLSFERNLCGKYSDAYRNGVRFRAAIAGNRKIYAFRQQLGYTLSREKTPEHQKRLRELSDLFSDKANEILKTLRREFGEPSWETGAKLRAKPDQKAYDRYRELVCETVQLTRQSVWFWLESILGYDHSEGWAQERKEFDQFRAKTRRPLSLTACIQHARNSGRNYAGLSDPVQNSDEMAGAMFLFEYDKCKSFLGLYTKGYATAEDKKENVRELM